MKRIHPILCALAFCSCGALETMQRVDPSVKVRPYPHPRESAPLPQMVPKRHRIRRIFDIRKLPGDSTRVVADIFGEEEDLYGNWSSAYIRPPQAKAAYDLLFSKISDKLRKEFSKKGGTFPGSPPVKFPDRP